MKEIILEVKNVYGNDLIYPSCHIANALIKLKDKKKGVSPFPLSVNTTGALA